MKREVEDVDEKKQSLMRELLIKWDKITWYTKEQRMQVSLTMRDAVRSGCPFQIGWF